MNVLNLFLKVSELNFCSGARKKLRCITHFLIVTKEKILFIIVIAEIVVGDLEGFSRGSLWNRYRSDIALCCTRDSKKVLALICIDASDTKSRSKSDASSASSFLLGTVYKILTASRSQSDPFLVSTLINTDGTDPSTCSRV